MTGSDASNGKRWPTLGIPDERFGDNAITEAAPSPEIRGMGAPNRICVGRSHDSNAACCALLTASSGARLRCHRSVRRRPCARGTTAFPRPAAGRRPPPARSLCEDRAHRRRQIRTLGFAQKEARQFGPGDTLANLTAGINSSAADGRLAQ
jgi:hypothetical protein